LYTLTLFKKPICYLKLQFFHSFGLPPALL